ncbi:hypothetical protein K437DRAFT_261259 [Tilletiaria anomala UBC 951]|uniref:Major facilitator superfamily (MFS) profile domain-containing protein n=1 Tax=Tilletiaria anomala (strain ATCC 24038 / CBS 436.72 / UBC 951) TaxID=1037660 RepID=A0A066WPV2_TILAU|nr:uncharacterized protein K437DRAFT_261259 [Tilletiaria anomala UBC 951]KDN52660.1 hypothetical protein K437DRAFT_261259 [Tilletiaria anomala UBC 951]
MSHSETEKDVAKGRSSDGSGNGVKLATEEVDKFEIALDANDSGEVKNPLYGVPRSKLLRDAEQFAHQHGLVEHVELIQRGALVAQNQSGFQSIPDLSDEEKAALVHEVTHKWSHPFVMYATIFCCSIGAATQGWDQTGSNGANLSFPKDFDISTEKGNPNAYNNTWLVGAVNAAPYIGSALCGCWLSDPLNNAFGRRGCIFITAVILVITPICSGFTRNWWELFIVRFLLGIGMGAKGSTVPVFAAENSPARIRGALVMGWQLWTAFGIFLGTCANVVVKDVGKIAWRLQLGSAFIPALPLAIFIYFCPESPRWLMKKNRYAEAFESLVRLRHNKIQAARDLYYIHTLLQEERKIIRGTTYVQRIAELFTIPRVRRATIASGVVMLAQQMCGINIIAFYSSTIFEQAYGSVDKALYASLGFGAVNFFFAFPALFTIDTFGRRNLLLFTFPQMAWCLLGGGLSFLIPSNADGTPGPGRVGAISFFVFLFAAFYSPGEGPVPFTYSAEVFPLAQREAGMSWAVTVCLGFAAILSVTFPAMLDVMTPTGAFCFYAGLNVIAFVMIFFLVPETKALTLEELDQVFAVPTGKFADYQLNKALPYFFKRWVFWRKDAKLEPLIRIDDTLIVKPDASKV